jgi:hypothetical protein
MNLIDRYRIWRLRPGILFAAKLAERKAWGHKNANMLGPEMNLCSFSHALHMRLMAAEEGDTKQLCIDPVVPLPDGWVTAESES